MARAFLMLFVFIGCNTTEVMLPETFPMFRGLYQDEKFFRVNYDTNKDGEIDTIVWYVYRKDDQRFLWYYPPYRVERFHLGLLVERKTNVDLAGKLIVVERLVDGRWTTSMIEN